MTLSRSNPRAKPRWVLLGGGVSMMLLVLVTAVLANHGLASLPGSTFEIDDNANLKLDHAGLVDWGSLPHTGATPLELRRTDAPTGQQDDSYKGGVKEDTECPGEVTGSIPNNKSDLLTFHLYEESGTPGFVNIAWGRVSDPSGTTLMDFEFNQSSTPCAVGPNVQRTEGDLLIEYAIDQGGARAEITGRFWTGTAWGPALDLDDGTACGDNPCAVGTINNTAALPATESDGLGLKALRTFGEAQIDLDLIFDEGKCTSFGSAMLKSRSSDAFTSQLKDFIRPIPIDLQNCGNVIIRKQTLPDEDPNATAFGYTKAFDTDPSSDETFTLTDDGVQDYEDTVLFGTGYTVVEDDIPEGWEFFSLDCSASENVTPSITGATVTFDIDSDSDVLDCTYTNQTRGTIIVEKETVTGAGSFDFTSATLDPASWTLTTTEPGEAGVDSLEFSDLAPGTYDADETVPANWNLDSATCDDGSPIDAIDLSAGETVTCRFVNEQETGAIEVTKTRKHAATPLNDAHADVTFTISGGSLADPVEVMTDENGVACLDGLLDGDYTVTESVPDGYSSDDSIKEVTVSDESACGDGNEATVSFHNTPLTNITVSVDSQVDGGTASTISCVDAEGDEVASGSTGTDGDGDVSVDDLIPTYPAATLVCTSIVDP
jgi:hypothetical protein